MWGYTGLNPPLNTVWGILNLPNVFAIPYFVATASSGESLVTALAFVPTAILLSVWLREI